MGLVDFLRHVDIFPDNVIGHSVGELCCAYADGCLTTKETILFAYHLGLACTESQSATVKMVEVGIGYQDLNKICPNDIEIAYHNGPSNCIISGSTKSIDSFVTNLKVSKHFQYLG